MDAGLNTGADEVAATPLGRFAGLLKNLSPTRKRTIVVLADALTALVALAVAMFLRVGELWVTPAIAIAAVCVVIVVPATVWLFGLYDAVFRHVGLNTAKRLGQALFAFAVPWALIVTTFSIEGIPRTMGLLFPLVAWLALVGTRYTAQWLLRQSEESRASGRARALIYGAGSAGRQLAAAIDQSGEMVPVGFIDDDPRLQGRSLDRRPIIGAEALGEVIEAKGVTHVLLALPQIERRQRNEIIGWLKPYPVSVKTLPSLMHIAHGQVEAADLRDLDIEDLLGRDRVDPDHKRMEQFVQGRVVLVSGAGGSIGSELCRQIAVLQPATLLLVERSEVALYEIHRELSETPAIADGTMELVALLASVTDQPRLDAILTAWSPDIVFHAAAYKHVPLVEANPVEGIRNNVSGTLTLARAAVRHGCGHFVLVSTDKAVRPTNVMGASKRLAELVCQALAAESGSTMISMVRFGNVLGSSGSVVPLFRRQIAEGGPVTVTHREMTRYFMLISEAAQLVIQAGAMARGGELFLLEMGEPVKIIDLAMSMIQLAGARPRLPGEDSGEVEVVEVGLRPGEKMYEELLIDASARPTSHPLIRCADEPALSGEQLWPQLEALFKSIEQQNTVAALAILVKLVPEYTSRASSDAVSAGEQSRRQAHVEKRSSDVGLGHRLVMPQSDTD